MSMTISHQYINLDYLDTMTGGDAETMQQMLDMLIEEIPTELDKMQDAVVATDWNEVFQISHKLKMTLAFIGHEEMVSINKTIEHCARHTVDLPEIPLMATQLLNLSKPAVQELKNVSF